MVLLQKRQTTTCRPPYIHGPHKRVTIQSCVKTFPLSFENRAQNDPLLTQKLHSAALFQPAIPETWQ